MISIPSVTVATSRAFNKILLILFFIRLICKVLY